MANFHMGFQGKIWLLLACAGWVSVLGVPGADAASRLRTTASIAAAGDLILIKGAVTYYDSTTGILVVQDETGGVVVRDAGKRLEIAVGDQVEVEGLTELGAFRPAIGKSKITVVS